MPCRGDEMMVGMTGVGFTLLSTALPEIPSLLSALVSGTWGLGPLHPGAPVVGNLGDKTGCFLFLVDRTGLELRESMEGRLELINSSMWLILCTSCEVASLSKTQQVLCWEHTLSSFHSYEKKRPAA